jgi:phosphatidylinositol alpha-1,6-mannosyltransferase
MIDHAPLLDAVKGAPSQPGELPLPKLPSRPLVLLTDAFGGRGGIAKFNRDLLQALCSFPEVREVVALPRLAPDPIGPLPAKLNYVGAALGGKRSYIAALLQTTIAARFDLVICAHINLLPLAAVAAARCRAPLLLIVHGIDAWQPTGRRLTDWLVRRVDACVAVSDFTRQRFLRWSGLPSARAHVLPNCVDLGAFAPGAKDPALLARYGLEGRRVLFTLARLSASERYKGIDEVLDCLPKLTLHEPKLAYLIAGDGDDRARLEAKVHALGLDQRVVFAGRIPEHEKAAHYRLADAFVMPSCGEGFGIVFLEAMACGVPVLASTLDASREAVHGCDAAVLVDPRQQEELLSGLRRVLSLPRTPRPPESLGQYSRERFDARLYSTLSRVYRS